MTSPYPLRTARLLLRVMRRSDAEVFAGYRNDPQVAALQAWDLPFTVADAARVLDGQDDRDDVRAGAWTQLAVELDGTVIGDVCCHLDPDGGIAEIGYTLATAHQGHGFAREAVRAMVDDLVDRVGVVRIVGQLDPDNLASQRLLEDLGLTLESVTRRSCRWRGQWADTMTYGATAEEYRAWRDRPRQAPDVVRLVPLTPANVGPYRRLATHASQRRFVAPMLDSFADALFPDVVDGAPVVPRLFGIEADGVAVGFVMIAEATEAHPLPYLWRLLVDRRSQHRGIGRRALDALVGMLSQQGPRALLISWHEGAGGPAPFYLRYGFEPTGRIVDGETEGRLALTPNPGGGDRRAAAG